MKIKYLAIAAIIGFLCLPSVVLASSPYCKIDVYFNDNVLPGKEIAQPSLRVNEPFNVKVNVAVYQECRVSGKLTTLGEDYFKVINGTSKIDQYSRVILKANGSHMFEWTVIPTDKWAGGSIPINFHYSIVEKGNPEPVVNSEFTVAYCTISNEYYEGETPASENSESQPTPEQPASENSAPAASAPAFSLLTAIVALALAFFRFFHQ
ncbi:sarcinarray family MAST domain-containing protein [Methanosarcina sp. MSH10X1]|uniref:sarcinarray family MAST domain-containing protein n=1 Tax=Methanosarcina sp. MSH10X1 TaxID=2507075 RepID=UPI000FFC4B98|nr:sarcinarray family MAST domain-containing protein [Methanosarcina sp. MSH10X1]RXA21685.1 sarcinarray family MAST domain-containing protein [Methanosarcina sp. MSH10X1]